MERRNFLKNIGALSAFGALPKLAFAQATTKPIVVSTWAANTKANAAAYDVLANNGYALDAVEAGVRVPEADPTDRSVGLGGNPDRDGKVTLDACIMSDTFGIGSVMAIENIMHAISVARMVMEKTPHVQLAGDGALQFALQNGFEQQNLLTPESEADWKKWLEKSSYNPMTTVEELYKRNWPNKMADQHQHDTIGMLALDAQSRLCGACTTSGMAYKMHGRVGDSPIIGAGLYVDNTVGSATSSGIGEEVVRICGSHLVVQYMAQGYNPEKACKKAVDKIIQIHGAQKAKAMQVGFIALSKKGEIGAYAIQKGFSYAVHSAAGVQTFESKYLV
jgi:N4-(beta-N-acetylglucosaminyl)-L-asparaginase